MPGQIVMLAYIDSQYLVSAVAQCLDVSFSLSINTGLLSTQVL